jgi:hypothetical protein
MQPTVHPRPVRVIVEIDPGQVSQLVTTVLHQLTTPPRASQAEASQPAVADPPEEEGPSIDRTSDPPPPCVQVPVASNGHKPPLPRKFSAKTFYVGKLCDQGHSEAGAPFSVRYKSSHSCVTCEHERAATRRGQRNPSQRPPPQVTATTGSSLPDPAGREEEQERPALPAHLAETCFLSPIVCEVQTHRYRNTAYTLRFLDDEDCCQCVVHTRTLKAGD